MIAFAAGFHIPATGDKPAYVLREHFFAPDFVAAARIALGMGARGHIELLSVEREPPKGP